MKTAAALDKVRKCLELVAEFDSSYFEVLPNDEEKEALSSLSKVLEASNPEQANALDKALRCLELAAEFDNDYFEVLPNDEDRQALSSLSRTLEADNS